MASDQIIKRAAMQALVESGQASWDDFQEARIGYPELTSAVTAVFHVRVVSKDGASYEVPVTTRVSYSHPVAIPQD